MLTSDASSATRYLSSNAKSQGYSLWEGGWQEPIRSSDKQGRVSFFQEFTVYWRDKRHSQFYWERKNQILSWLLWKAFQDRLCPQEPGFLDLKEKKTWKLETQEDTGSQPTSHEDQPTVVAILSSRHWAAERHFLALCWEMPRWDYHWLPGRSGLTLWVWGIREERQRLATRLGTVLGVRKEAAST